MSFIQYCKLLAYLKKPTPNTPKQQQQQKQQHQIKYILHNIHPLHPTQYTSSSSYTIYILHNIHPTQYTSYTIYILFILHNIHPLHPIRPEMAHGFIRQRCRQYWIYWWFCYQTKKLINTCKIWKIKSLCVHIYYFIR